MVVLTHDVMRRCANSSWQAFFSGAHQTWANNSTGDRYLSKTCRLAYNLCMNRLQIYSIYSRFWRSFTARGVSSRDPTRLNIQTFTTLSEDTGTLSFWIGCAFLCSKVFSVWALLWFLGMLFRQLVTTFTYANLSWIINRWMKCSDIIKTLVQRKKCQTNAKIA